MKRRLLQELTPDTALSDSSLVAVRGPRSQERRETSFSLSREFLMSFHV